METLLEMPRPSVAKIEAAPRAARLAVTSLFFLNGCLFGTWVSRIPAVEIARGLSHGELGLALLAMAAGALIAMPLAGRMSARFGSHRVCQWMALFYAAVLPVLVVAPGVIGFAAALFCFGAGHGALDVAMNAQAVVVESRYRRPLMSSFHALFSGGGLVGASVGGLLAGCGVWPLTHFGAMAGGLAILCALFAFPHLIDDREPDMELADSAIPPLRFSLPSPRLLAIGAVAFCAMLGEGAMADWSAIFLRQSLHSTEAMAAAGYAAFSITMAATRFFGDRLSSALGSVHLVRLGGGLAVTGIAAALISPSPLAAMIAFGCVGAGFATVVPMAFSAAGRTRGIPSGVALASATTVGYLGFLIGPPIIGFTAQGLGLRFALGLLLLSSSLIVALAPATGSENP